MSERDVDETEATMVRRSPLAASPAAETVLHALVVIDDSGDIRRIGLTTEGMRIGRIPGNDLVLPVAEVSRRHAQITFEGSVAMLADLGSTNGTWLEGRRIEGSVALPPGTRFTIGPYTLHYQRGAQQEMQRAAEMEAELERAFRYTLALLPAPIEDGPVRAEWRYKPSARIGGDAFGYRFLDASRFAVFLLDVAGHGVGSALLAASVTNVMRSSDLADPGAMLARLNEAFQMDDQGGLFFTVWCGVADLAARRLDFAAAGHHPGYLLHPDATAPQPLETRNPPIGVMPGLSFRAGSAALPRGARLVLFSDGAFETTAADGSQRGLPDFLPLLSGPPQPGPGTAERLLQAARLASRPGPFDDDASILSLDFP